MMHDYHMIDAENIQSVKKTGAGMDQRQALEIGDETWGFFYGSQRGQMSRYKSGRGAVCTGGDSEWGDWITLGKDAPLESFKGHQVLALDNGDYWVTEEGEWREAGTGEPVESVPPTF